MSRRLLTAALLASPPVLALACGGSSTPPTAPTNPETPQASASTTSPVASSTSRVASSAPSAQAADAGASDPYAARQSALKEAAEFGEPMAEGGRGSGVGLGTLGASDASGPGGRKPLGGAGGPSGVDTTIRQGAVSVNGRLPPEIVQRIVRQSVGRFRLCYVDSLAKTPSLEGRVSVAFEIDAAGNVKNARDAGSDLPDAAAVACMVKVYATLSFPKPDGGTVQVKSPLIFAPGSKD